MKAHQLSSSCKRVVHFTLAALSVACISSVMAADIFPNKTIQLISPLPTGGSTDVATRAWMNCATQSKHANQPIVLLNKPGANGIVAVSALKQAPNDDHNLFVAGMSQLSITPYIFKKQPYDPAKDFQGAAIFGTTPFMMVASVQSGIKSIKDLETRAKSSGKGVDLGMPVIASPAHLLSAALAEKLSINTTLVPQGSEANGVTAMLAGQLDAMIFVSGSISQYVETGKVNPLMVFTEKRLPAFPNVPTVLEILGDKSFVRYGWLGIATKGGASKESVKAVESWTKACLETQEFSQALRNALFTPRFIDAEEYAEIVRQDTAFWKPWITKLGISND